ncbi:MAG: hypothetical protein AB1486_23280 [Planctomycetota bacterium]
MKLDEYVNVAFRAKVVAENGAEEPADTVGAAERGDSLVGNLDAMDQHGAISYDAA